MHVVYEWEAAYAPWRLRDPVTAAAWSSQTPRPKKRGVDRTDWQQLPPEERQPQFQACLAGQAKDFASRVLKYRSPVLDDVTALVRAELAARNARVVVAVFWGRHRYVSILWRYLERNLLANHGIVDQVMAITLKRDRGREFQRGSELLLDATRRYPGHVVQVPFCSHPFGCAYDDILTDPNVVYVKLDDDIIFIKDGSFEHLVYQTLFNKDYTFYSGSVVNNPHSYGVHKFAGACERAPSRDWGGGGGPTELLFSSGVDALVTWRVHLCLRACLCVYLPCMPCNRCVPAVDVPLAPPRLAYLSHQPRRRDGRLLRQDAGRRGGLQGPRGVHLQRGPGPPGRVHL